MSRRTESEEFRKLFTHIESGGRHYLDRGAELVSHAVADDAMGRTRRCAGVADRVVDAVSTHPQYEGRGYGSVTMRRLAAEIDDYEIAGVDGSGRAFIRSPS